MVGIWRVLEFDKTTTPGVGVRFTRNLAQKNDIVRTLAACKSQQVVFLERLGEGLYLHESGHQPRNAQTHEREKSEKNDTDMPPGPIDRTPFT